MPAIDRLLTVWFTIHFFFIECPSESPYNTMTLHSLSFYLFFLFSELLAVIKMSIVPRKYSPFNFYISSSHHHAWLYASSITSFHKQTEYSPIKQTIMHHHTLSYCIQSHLFACRCRRKVYQGRWSNSECNPTFVESNINVEKKMHRSSEPHSTLAHAERMKERERQRHSHAEPRS